MTGKDFGLSRKTNVAIAGIAGVGIVKDVLWAIAAVVLITLVAITYQFVVDYWKK